MGVAGARMSLFGVLLVILVVLGILYLAKRL